MSNLQWAIVDQLKNPAAGFEEAIRVHFYMKRHELRTMASAWVAEAEEREAQDARRGEKLERDRKCREREERAMVVKAEREAKAGIAFTTSATHTMMNLGLTHADGSAKLTKVKLNTRKKESGSTCTPSTPMYAAAAVDADAATVGHVTALKAQVAAMETELAKLEASPPVMCVKVLQARNVVLQGKAAEKAEEKKRKKAEKDRRVANKLVTELEKSM